MLKYKYIPPHKLRSLSQNPTPEPTPRFSNKSQTSPLKNASPSVVLHSNNNNSSSSNHHNNNSSNNNNNTSGDYYGSANSLGTTPHSLCRNSDLRGSSNSLASSAGGTIRSRKTRRAPVPPTVHAKELFPTPGLEPATDTSICISLSSTPSSSTRGTPKQGRKKRPAPAPPKPARLDAAVGAAQTLVGASKNSLSYPLQSELDSKLSDEEKALLEGKQQHQEQQPTLVTLTAEANKQKRLIPLDDCLLQDEEDSAAVAGGKCDDLKYREHEQEQNVVYRRVLIPSPMLKTALHEEKTFLEDFRLATHNRQLEKLKDNKEAKNRNRQSQISAASSGAEDSDPLYNSSSNNNSNGSNKSSHGKWKRRKGPAPALPIPPRKVLQMLPLQEIKHELEIIEVQQQGLEKQGVILEKMIRDRCEGDAATATCELLSDATPEEATTTSGTDDNAGDKVAPVRQATGGTAGAENSKEVEDLILQLFELVNEKNELFRRQAELMYLRRQHRLEQEQADIEYEIRVLMAQPERNKTDTDKAREEALIGRLVEVVQLRNEVIECLEMDRLREAEEDMSIKRRLELHASQREDDTTNKSQSKSCKLSKKEKKKQKETKKLAKNKKLDVDKDADETELNSEKVKNKKKKKKFFF